jgi:hypothetical protein
MPNRNVRQCRERYKNYLAPNLRQGDWTAEEDALLTQLFMEHGAKWNTISRSFVNRSDISLRNRWQQLERRMMKTGATTPVEVEDSPQPIQTPDVVPKEPEVTVAAPAQPVVRSLSPFGLADLFDARFDPFSDPFDTWSTFY